MFQLQEILDAHAKVKSGADFPQYIQDLIGLGVQQYNTFVSNGRTIYDGADGHQVDSGRKYSGLRVANISDQDRFKHHLRSHQRGQTDYPTFCKYAAETGVEKWTVDTENMTCTYYDKSNNAMLEEKIPTP